MSAHGGAFLMSTKQSGDLSWTVCVRRPTAECSGDPWKPAAGQCRTSGMCTWSKEEVPEQDNEGRRGGAGASPFAPFTRKQESGTWFCDYHTKERIEDTGRGGEDWDSGIFS